MSNLHFTFIISGWQCESYCSQCLDSLKKLNNKNWSARVINDGSTDKTLDILQAYDVENYDIKIYNFLDNKFAAYRRWQLLKNQEIDDEEVIILLGLDDAVFPDALDEIEKVYTSGVMMSYGNWVNQFGVGLPKTFPLEFDQKTHDDRDYRQVTYRSTGLNTFKYKLFKKLKEEDFIIDGEWLKTCTEGSLMFSFLEMCGQGRIGIVHKHICLYNSNRPDGSIYRFTKEYKYEILDKIKKQPKKPIYEEC